MKQTNRHFKLEGIKNFPEVVSADVFVALTKHNSNSSIQEYSARLIVKTDRGNTIDLYYKGEGFIVNSKEEIFEQAKADIIGKFSYEQTLRNSRKLKTTTNGDRRE